MELILYTNNSEDNRIVKSLVQVADCTGTLLEPSNIIDPSILVAITSVTSVNYAYIPQFGRYYFVRSMVCERQAQFTITMHCDVLMTYAVAIKACKGILKESTSKNISNYLPSNSWVTLQKDSTFIKTFPTGLPDNGEFILITAGG